MLIQILLEASEDLSNFFWRSKICNSIEDRVVIFEVQQKRQLLLIQFFDADADGVSSYKVQKGLLLVVEVRIDGDFRPWWPVPHYWKATARSQHIGTS